MPFVRNFPFFTILLPMLCGILCMPANAKWARRIAVAASSACTLMSAAVLIHTVQTGQRFVYQMGHYPAPFGNEIRAGAVECLMALAFCTLMLLSILGGQPDLDRDVPEKKQHFFFAMMNLLLAGMLVVTYTNDLFTAYVFIDIITIAACSAVAAKPQGRTLIATTGYLVMSLLGSGLFLLSIAFLYSITGHLLMPNIHSAVQGIMETGLYLFPLFVILGLMVTGLSVKSALFPFHRWLPDAHTYATTTASAVLSGLILKCYLILIIKIFVRIIGTGHLAVLRIPDMLLVFGVAGLLIGSVNALRQKQVKRMLSFASVSQIGFIAICIGLGTTQGFRIALFHILAHAAAKSMLFVAAGGLMRAAGGQKDVDALRGAGRLDPLAGAAFALGALSMVGLPLFSGFVSKLYLAQAAMADPVRGAIALAAIVASTVLGAMYYFPAAAGIFAGTPGGGSERPRRPPAYRGALTGFMAINLTLGLCSGPILRALDLGLATLGGM